MNANIQVHPNTVISKLLEEISRLNMELAVARSALEEAYPKESTNGGLKHDSSISEEVKRS